MSIPVLPTRDYSCGAGDDFCDDPACNLHGPKEEDSNLFLHPGGSIGKVLGADPYEVAGWYFWDEAHVFYHGPFETKSEASEAMRMYSIVEEMGIETRDPLIQVDNERRGPFGDE